jgi:NitT/TauT family transport system substrate-binding protein
MTDGRRRYRGMTHWAALLLGVAVAANMAVTIQPSGAQDGTLKLVFPTPPVPYDLPYFIAKDLGWLDKAGVKVEELWLTGDTNAIKAAIAGSADIGSTGANSLYTAIAEGAKVKAIGSWQPTVDYVVLAQKKVATFKDLRGATLAVAAGASPKGGDILSGMLNLIMKKHGVDPSTTKLVSVGGHEARMLAVVARKADATLVGELYAAKAREFPDLHVLGRIPDEIPNVAYVYTFVTEQAVRQKGPLIERFTKLTNFDGTRYIVQNPDGAVDVLRKRIPALDPAIVKEVVHKLASQRLFGVDGGLDPKVTQYNIGLAQSLGYIEKPLRVEDVIDRRFVDKALAEVGPFR